MQTGGPIDALGVDELEKLTHVLDATSLSALASTGHALWDGSFSKLDFDKIPLGRDAQVLRHAARKFRTAAIQELEARVGPCVLAQLRASPDWRGKHLRPRDVCTITGLIVHELQGELRPSNGVHELRPSNELRPAVRPRLDGGALPAAQLSGADPVLSIDLANQGLGHLSALAIARLLRFNRALTSLDLSSNLMDDLAVRHAVWQAWNRPEGFELRV